MFIQSCVPKVQDLLKGAGRNHTTCSFRSLFALFDNSPSQNDVYDTLERASRILAPLPKAIPSALMARKNDGLPGDGFFDIFRTHRPQEYARIAGAGTLTLKLTLLQRQQIAADERSRVYAYAIVNRW